MAGSGMRFRTAKTALLIVLLLGCSVAAIPLGGMMNAGKAQVGSTSNEADMGGEGAAQERNPEKREHLRPQHGDDHGSDEDFQTFSEYDANGDGAVDLNEWLARVMGTHVKPEHHLYEVSGGKAGEPPETAEMEAEEKKRWTDEFVQNDRDKDGKLSWDDWAMMMYHENPQHPKYYDGYDDYPDYPPPVDQEKLEEQFAAHDVDKDQMLSLNELLAYLSDSHQADAESTLVGVEAEERAAAREQFMKDYEEETLGYARSLMTELDQNEDGQLSLHEWQMYYMDY